MTFLEIKNISKIFNAGEQNAVVGLDKVTLQVDRGEFAVISGPSGSGKTTLLNIIGGLDAPTAGEVVLVGKTLTGLSEKELSEQRRDSMGFVFQAYNLIPVLTGRENIEYVMNLQNRPKGACEARVMELARKLDIVALLDKLPSQMSGGQQQRVAVARAVAAKPGLVLADEPTANLDSKSAEGLMDMMQRLNEDEGVTVIFSSHDPMVIHKARRSISLKDGKVIRDEVVR